MINKYNFCISLPETNTFIFSKVDNEIKNKVIENCGILGTINYYYNSFSKQFEIKSSLKVYTIFNMTIGSYYSILQTINRDKSKFLNPKYVSDSKTLIELKILKIVHCVIYISTMFLAFTSLSQLIFCVFEKIFYFAFYALFIMVIADFVLFEIGSNFSLGDVYFRIFSNFLSEILFGRNLPNQNGKFNYSNSEKFYNENN